MRVFKFGGASIKDAEGIRNVAAILKIFENEKLLVVVSAIGKTTNHLEKVNQFWFQNQLPLAIEQLFEIRQTHINIINDLSQESNLQNQLVAIIDRLIFEMRQIITTSPDANFNQNYDQIVSYGELLSTSLLGAYLNLAGINAQWLDARNYVVTNNCFRDGRVVWDETENKISKINKDFFSKTNICLTQGFIGRVQDTNLTTTLGREGSDFSASIFAYCLNATEVVIWKDVPGVLNADPRLFPMAEKIDLISYQEAVELTYYGASVIHPKTIKPLQNKGISLRVQSFLKPNDQGTLIAASVPANHPVPFSIILKRNQALIGFETKDFGFVAEESLSIIFSELYKTGLRAHLMQNSAMQFSIVVDNDPFKLNPFLDAVASHFHINLQTELSLLTVRHASEKQLNGLIQGKTIVIEQYRANTAQLVLK